MSKSDGGIRIAFLRSSNYCFDSRLQSSINLFAQSYEVTVLDWDRSPNDSSRFEKPSYVKSFKSKSAYNRGLLNSFKMLTWQLFLIKQLMKIKPQVIWTIDLDTVLPAMLIKKTTRAKVVFEEYDSFDSRLGKKFIRIFRVLNKITIKIADLVIYPDKSRMVIRDEKMVTRSNFPTWGPSTRSLFSKRLNFTATYSGMITKDRMLEKIQSGVLLAEKWNMLIGGIGDVSLIERSEKIKYIGPFSPNETEKKFEEASIYFAFYDPTVLNNRLTASNKVMEAAALGIPIITNSGTNLAKMVENNNLGWVVEEPYEVGIKNALEIFENLGSEQILDLEEQVNRFFLSSTISFNEEVQIIRDFLKNWDRVPE
jgi:glycosyltransferase involved in cell wall biosynthesis